MLRPFRFYLSERETPNKFRTQYLLGRRLARRFTAGETLEDAVRAVRKLTSEGFAVTANQFEFQKLYSIRRQLQCELLRQGCLVRVYVP